jgi:YebC/PmpR family DNA-binding regulatory protein
MSGHSKWATTHRQKEANDAKKGAVFTKLAMAISIAVRAGGGIGDPDKNFRLRMALDKARQFNMPKENIARAIEKGMGGGAGIQLLEVMFEGFLPGGVAVMVQAQTDNHMRTQQQVRMIIEKGGGSLGSLGTVGYLFSHKGEVVADIGAKSAEEAELAVIDLGADDVEAEGSKLIVYCEHAKTYEIKEGMEKLEMKVESAELVMKPNSLVEVENIETRQRVEKILTELSELDDVSHVFTNYA